MSAPLRFVVPMPLNIANARLHWRVKENARQAYFASLDQRQGAGLLPPPPARPFASATIASRMVLGGRMDHDNAMARHKWVMDWLESRGYVANDRHCEWSGFPEQCISRKAESVIELTVTPL